MNSGEKEIMCCKFPKKIQIALKNCSLSVTDAVNCFKKKQMAHGRLFLQVKKK